MISLQSVTKSYFGQQAVLDRVQMELKKGDFLYVIGGSGAGKTTLLRLLATEEHPSSGVVSLFGYPVSSCTPSALRAIRRNIGYIPQSVRLLPDLSVQDNVLLSLNVTGIHNVTAQIRGQLHELLDRLGLWQKRGLPAQALSGGEAQRVAIARALIRNPQLIIADEPTGSQDRDHTWSLMELLLKANMMGSTVILATHDQEIVRRVRKRCAFLRNGHIQLEEGPGVCTY